MSVIYLNYAPDSPLHKRRVRELTDRLLTDGFDVNMDQYRRPILKAEGETEDPYHLGDDRRKYFDYFPYEMTGQATHIILVISKLYVNGFMLSREMGRKDDAQWKGLRYFQQAMERGYMNEAIIPVVLTPEDDQIFPEHMKLFDWFRTYEDEGYQGLCQRLKGESSKPVPTREQIAEVQASTGFFDRDPAPQLDESGETAPKTSPAVDARVREEKKWAAIELMQKANLLKDRDRYAMAINFMRQAETLFREANEGEQYMMCLEGQTQTHMAWRELDEALVSLGKLKDYHRDKEHWDVLARCHGSEASMLQDLGRPEEALKVLADEEQIHLRTGNNLDLAMCYWSTSQVYADIRRYDEAMEMLDKEEALHLESGNKSELAVCLGSKAKVLRDQKKYKESLDMHGREQAIYEELGNRSDLAHSWWAEGIVHGRLGYLNQKALLWHKSIDARKELGLRVEQEEKKLKKLEKEIAKSKGFDEDDD